MMKVVRLGDLFHRIRTETEERIDRNLSRGSVAAYENIRHVEFIFLPDALAQRALGVAGAKVKLPRELLAKQCCINLDNSDGFCFRYAAICLGNKTYEADNSCRTASELYLQNVRKGLARRVGSQSSRTSQLTVSSSASTC